MTGEFYKRIMDEQDRQLAKGRDGRIPFYVIHNMIGLAKKEFPFIYSSYIGVDGSDLEVPEKDCNGRIAAEWFVKWFGDIEE